MGLVRAQTLCHGYQSYGPFLFEEPCSPRSTAVRQNLRGMRSLLRFMDLILSCFALNKAEHREEDGTRAVLKNMFRLRQPSK
jgi:hypothetical protein